MSSCITSRLKFRFPNPPIVINAYMSYAITLFEMAKCQIIQQNLQTFKIQHTFKTQNLKFKIS